MSDSKTVSGAVHKVGEVQNITDNFSKRELVIDTGDRYSPYLPISFTNKKMSLLDNLQVGQQVTVYINLGGREGKDGRFWPDISGWQINLGEGVDPTSPPADNQDQGGGLPSFADDIPFSPMPNLI